MPWEKKFHALEIKLPGLEIKLPGLEIKSFGHSGHECPLMTKLNESYRKILEVKLICKPLPHYLIFIVPQ